ncbi:MAG: hypothetical protein IPM35_38020 [Myxococcales bacterium]|nr:hypothetical protein [Myxococcales bacterium]
MRRGRVVFGSLAVFGALCLAPPAARADTTKQACVQAYVDAQRLRKADKLSEARQKLELCADDACPATVKKDCKAWVDENERDQPTLALSALDLDGKKTITVKVLVDGVSVGDQLPSSPIKVDPGAHKVRFEATGLAPIEIEVSLQKGEKAREVLADFSKQKKDEAPAPAAPNETGDSARATRKTPVLVYVLGGVGVLGVASFAYFGSTGKSEEDELADTCAPNCSQSKVDAAHQKMLIADISLGVGAVALGAAAYLYFTRPKQTESATVVGFAPLGRGGAAFVGGRF